MVIWLPPVQNNKKRGKEKNSEGLRLTEEKEKDKAAGAGQEEQSWKEDGRAAWVTVEGRGDGGRTE